jgi:hypothetical protein
MVAIGIAVLRGQLANCEPLLSQNEGNESNGNLFAALIGGVVRAADDFRKGSEALDRFRVSLASIQMPNLSLAGTTTRCPTVHPRPAVRKTRPVSDPRPAFAKPTTE